MFLFVVGVIFAFVGFFPFFSLSLSRLYGYVSLWKVEVIEGIQRKNGFWGLKVVRCIIDLCALIDEGCLEGNIGSCVVV